MLRRDARPGIADGELRHLPRHPHGEPHLAGGGEFDRVGQQIDQNLAQPRRVGRHGFRQGLRTIEHEADAARLGLVAEHVGDLAEKIIKPDVAPLDLDPPSLDFRDIHQPFDQPGQMLAGAPDHPQRMAAFFRNRRVDLEQLRISQNRIERRAQFMADADHETALGQIGRFRRLTRAGQLRIGALVRRNLGEQQAGLLRGLALRGTAGFPRQHAEPRDHAGHDREQQKRPPQRPREQRGRGGIGRTRDAVQRREQAAEQQHRDREHEGKPQRRRRQAAIDRARQCGFENGG